MRPLHAIVVRQRVHSGAIEARHRAPPHFQNYCAGVNQLPAGRCALAPGFDHFSLVVQVAAPRRPVLLEARRVQTRRLVHCRWIDCVRRTMAAATTAIAVGAALPEPTPTARARTRGCLGPSTGEALRWEAGSHPPRSPAASAHCTSAPSSYPTMRRACASRCCLALHEAARAYDSRMH